VVPLRSLLNAQDEAEFAGVLAHSIGHVSLRHSLRTVTRGQAPNYASVPLIFVGGTSGCHVSAQAPLAVPLGMLNQFRDAELEADQFGLELANRTGFDAAGFVRYIERSQAEDAAHSPLPSRELRLSRLRETQASLPPAAERSASEEFRKVQVLARQLSAQAPRRVPTLYR
jgi:predicted Zn-dependent protease